MDETTVNLRKNANLKTQIIKIQTLVTLRSHIH